MSVSDTLKVGQYSVNTGLFINNEWVKGNGEPFATINPATEEEIGKIQSANEADVDAAVNAARTAFETTYGSNMPGQERGRLLFALADALAKSKDEIAYLESVDSGKPISWCKADNDDAVACLRYYAGMADKLQGSYIPLDDSKYAVTVREAVGVVGLILPWNYPTAISCWKLGPALAAGCTVVFKMAETTPLATLKLAELFKEVGYPAGVFNVVNGLGNPVGNAISYHMDIDKVSFTGSTATGRKIAEAAAKSNLKAVTLELGGKSPNIVFKGADLKEASKWSAFAVFENMGQTCTAGSRLLVQSSVYDEFVKHYLEAVSQIKVGDPLDAETFQGPQNSKQQYEKILGMIESGKETAKLLTGGARHGDKGYFIQPTVFGDVDMNMKIAQEEIFGPVSSIIKFETEEEAIKIANDTNYGLAAAIHTLDARQISRVTKKLRAGTVWVNQYTLLSHAVPFGGYKQSGWGRELGLQGLDAYLITKSIHHYNSDESFDWPIVL